MLQKCYSWGRRVLTETLLGRNFAHYLKLLSESFSYCMWTAYEASIFVNEDPKIFMDLNNSLKDIHDLSNKYSLKLYDDPLYDKYRV